MSHRHVLRVSLSLTSAFFALLTLFLTMGSFSVYAQGVITRYVAPGGNCGGMTPCYATIQAAVNASSNDSQILVASGVYTRSEISSQLVDIQSLRVKIIRGGYTITNWILSDPVANPTIVDAQGRGRVINIAGTAQPIIENLHITGAGAGGIYINSPGATISSCLIYNNNNVNNSGGGIYVAGGGTGITTTLKANSIFSNTAGYGGGIYVYGNGNVIVVDNIVITNTAKQKYSPYGSLYGDGGGLYLNTSFATLNNNIIQGNTADRNGGGVYTSKDNSVFYNNVIDSNVATSSGGAVCLGGGNTRFVQNRITQNNAGGGGGGIIASGSPILSSNAILSNTAISYGGGIAVSGSGTPTLLGNSIKGNVATYDGGGIYIVSSAGLLDGNVVMGNRAGYSGGGIYLSTNNQAPNLANNVIAENEANTGSGIYLTGGNARFWHTTIAGNKGVNGDGIYVADGPATFTNTILTGQNTGVIAAKIGQTVLMDGVLWSGNAVNTGGAGNVSVSNPVSGNPAFVNPAGGDYHLTPASAAVNRGMATEYPLDMDGEYRPGNGLPDLGADEIAGTPQCRARLNGGTIYPTLQTAIDASASASDIIEVAGVCEDSVSGIENSYVAVLSKTLKIKGGYSLDFNTWAPEIYPTVLNGRWQGGVLAINAGTSPTLEYFTLLGGQGGRGGGIWSNGTAPQLRQLQVLNNAASQAGGGIYWNSPSGVIETSLVEQNRAADGAGIYLVNSAALINSNIIRHNNGFEYGGGINLQTSPATLQGNTISDNFSIKPAGGVYLYKSAARVIGNSIQNNQDGGVHLEGSSNAIVRGNTIQANTGNGISSAYGSNFAIDNNIIQNNQSRGVAVRNTSLVALTHNVIRGNKGGGVSSVGANNLLDGNLIDNNSATLGGGVSLSGYSGSCSVGSHKLTNNIITNNRADKGGGIASSRNIAHLIHNTIANNTSQGIYAYTDSCTGYNSPITLTNTILVSQTRGIEVTTGNTATLEATLWGNTEYDWGGGGTIITGSRNIWTDPNFADPITGNYHLKPNSAAVDAGVSTDVSADIDGDNRSLGLAPDLGADETTMHLTLNKTGPFTAKVNEPITYTLTVVNDGAVLATHPVITDRIPDGAIYQPGSGGTQVGNVISWTAPSLAPGQTITGQFTVVATQTIVNHDYQVSVAEGISVTGDSAVVTLITGCPPNAVCVMDENNQPIPGAWIYRNGELVTDPYGNPKQTDVNGILPLNTLSPGETLVAFQPVYTQPTHRTAHNPDGKGDFAFRVYRTSMPVNNDGSVTPYVVAASNQPHTLTISPDHTLVLFNLVVSVEWDADEEYLAQLRTGLADASNRLYDASDGQMAFGRVTIYDNADEWSNADIQIQTHNHTWPYAYVGGINSRGNGRLIYHGLDFEPGQIVLGRYWDGKSGNTGKWDRPDGSATIVHEFGHYGLFLFDEYFYYADQAGERLAKPARCSINKNDPASLMYYQYQYVQNVEIAKTELCNRPEQYSPLTRQTQVYGQQETSWVTLQGIYSQTLQAITGGNPPWSIISPPQRGVDFVLGPAQPPLSVPKISINNRPANAINRKEITVKDPHGNRVWGALVALRRVDGVVMDQGLTDRDGKIEILGAGQGDIIRARTQLNSLAGSLIVKDGSPETMVLSSVFGNSPGRLSAQETVTNTTPLITIFPRADGTTMDYFMAQTGLLDNPVEAEITGTDAPPSAAGTMSYDGSKDRYFISFSGYNNGSLNDLNLSVSTTIGISSVIEIGTGHKRSHTGDSGDDLDLTSTDGNLVLNAPGGSFADPTYVVVNPTNALPAPPPAGKVAIGQSYSIQPSGAITGAQRAMALTLAYQSISLGVVDENTITPYYWAASAEGGGQWTPVVSYILDTAAGQVSASSDLFGIYVLFGQTPGPVVSQITPISGTNKASTIVYIEGDDFKGGAKIRLQNATAAITITASFISGDGKTLSASIPAGLIPGIYDVIVINPDTLEGVLVNGFTVTGDVPNKTYLPVILK